MNANARKRLVTARIVRRNEQALHLLRLRNVALLLPHELCLAVPLEDGLHPLRLTNILLELDAPARYIDLCQAVRLAVTIAVDTMILTFPFLLETRLERLDRPHVARDALRLVMPDVRHDAPDEPDNDGQRAQIRAHSDQGLLAEDRDREDRVKLPHTAILDGRQLIPLPC